MVNVGAANRADLLQARIEARQERVALENARTQYDAAWRQRAALVGEPALPPGRLDGDLESAAVCLLHSFANPAHERRVTELLANDLRARLESYSG